ncbi:Transcriptional regulator, AraC family [Cronobacter malonaticus 507]|nr:Transcriptional regulator, AraC family [Cronobacter malonaticus 507]
MCNRSKIEMGCLVDTACEKSLLELISLNDDIYIFIYIIYIK